MYGERTSLKERAAKELKAEIKRLVQEASKRQKHVESVLEKEGMNPDGALATMHRSDPVYQQLTQTRQQIESLQLDMLRPLRYGDTEHLQRLRGSLRAALSV